MPDPSHPLWKVLFTLFLAIGMWGLMEAFLAREEVRAPVCVQPEPFIHVEPDRDAWGSLFALGRSGCLWVKEEPEACWSLFGKCSWFKSPPARAKGGPDA